MMRKLFKENDLLVALMIVFIMLSTFAGYKIYAQEITPEMVSTGEGMANGEVGAEDYLTLADLQSRYPIFCCSKGTPLPGAGSVMLITEEGSENMGYVEPGEEVLKKFETILYGDDTTTPFEQGFYTHSTYAKYRVDEVRIAKPKEAYILAEMINNVINDRVGYEPSDVEFTDIDQLTWASYMILNGTKVYILNLDNPGDEIFVIKGPDDKYYIANEEDESGLGVYSYVQRAWWNTEAGGLGNDVLPNGLAIEADAFEAYIKEVALHDIDDTSKYVETPIKIGDFEGTVPAPQIEYNVAFNTGSISDNDVSYNLDNPTVKWEPSSEEFIIGPFSVNYVEANIDAEGRDPVMFAGITNAELTTDAQSEPLVRGTDWNFQWVARERTPDDTYEFPHKDEVFYIRLKYNDKATMVTGLSFDFKYMNAGGKYEKLVGKYYKVTWEAKEEAHTCTDGYLCSHGNAGAHDIPQTDGTSVHCNGGHACSHGRYVDHTDYTTYWIEVGGATVGGPAVSGIRAAMDSFGGDNSIATPVGGTGTIIITPTNGNGVGVGKPKHDPVAGIIELEAQRLAGGLIGARWYNEAHLERNLGINIGLLQVEKVVVNEKGEVIPDDHFFTFKITVNGQVEEIKVKANSTATSKAYYWGIDEKEPEFIVEEVDIPDGYEKVSLEPESGSLKARDTVKVVCKNKVDSNKGRLVIEKKLDEDTIFNENNLSNETFKMKATISGTFTYNDQKYTADGNPLVLDIDIKANESKETGYIYWNKNAENPTYVVEEVVDPNADYEIKKIENASGRITAENEGVEPVRVVVTNGLKEHKAKLRLIKTLTNAENLSVEDILNTTYTFSIEVENYEKYDVTLYAESDGNGGYVWKYTSDYFYWLSGQELHYTVEEKNNDGTKLTKVIINGQEYIVTNNKYSSVLIENADQDFIFDNQLFNDFTGPKTGKISLTKVIEDNEFLKNKDYRFYVTVYGSKFTYKNYTVEADQVLQLTNDDAVIYPKAEYDLGKRDGEKVVVIHIGEDLQNTWNSSDFVWYGTAPKYKVEEQLLGEEISNTIIPSEGTISNSAEPTKVTAYNNFTKEYGYVYIYKTLQDQKYIDDSIVKNISFKFKISVDGYEDIIVTVNPEKINGVWTWLYLSDPYFWDEGAEAPNCKVTEIIEDGQGYVMRLENAIGPEGFTFNPDENSISGKLVKGSLTREQLIAKLEEYKANGTTISGEDYFAKTKLEFFNNLKTLKHGNLEIFKKVDSESIKDVYFDFEVTIKGYFSTKEDFSEIYTSKTYNVSVSSTKSVKIEDTIYWVGDAPTYEVKELPNEKATLKSIHGATGRLENNSTVTVIAENTVDKVGGYLSIEKELTTPQGDKDDMFYFDASITMANGEVKKYSVAIKANETWTSDYIEWAKGENVPTYTVEETNSGSAHFVEITYPDSDENGKHVLKEGSTVRAIARNSYDKKHGKAKIIKQVIADEKLFADAKNETFNITYVISSDSYFKVAGETTDYGKGKNYVKEDITISANKPIETPEITWYGDKAPIITVSEDLGNKVDIGWKLINISNNKSSLTENKTVELFITNNIEAFPIIDLTMELGGMVWEDSDQDKSLIGVIEEGEKGVDGVEVYVKYPDGSLATIYDNLLKSEISQPIITSNGGKWNAPRVKVPAKSEGGESYNVEFVYDGQTYHATEFLAELNGDATAFKNLKNAEREKYYDNSMAKETNREEVDNRIQTIGGLSEINSDMTTLGNVNGNEGNHTVKYNGSIAKRFNYTYMNSILETIDPETGIPYDLFKANADTATAGLTYPFDIKGYSGISLTRFDTYYTPLGLAQYYQYHAIYKYALNINLGLQVRPKADVEISKDLEKETIYVNGELYTFDGNKLIDYAGKAYADQIEKVYSVTDFMKNMKQEQNLKYELGLYSTDYFYRAEMYDGNPELYTGIVKQSKELDLNPNDLDMKVYLTYKIVMENSSQDYNVKVNSIADYYDSSLRLVTAKAESFNKDKSSKITIADIGEDFKYNWVQQEQNIKSTDGNTYNKMTLELGDEGYLTESNPRQEIRVLFEVSKDTYNGVNDAIALGQKGNLVEITNYSTKYTNGNNAGKIDKDSAADNINIKNHCENAWIEDDTEIAPYVMVKLADANRVISGKAWEDRPEKDTALGNGVFDDDEAIITGLTTELVEKVEVSEEVINEDGTKEKVTAVYDFVWPTNKPLSQLGGQTVENLTGFDSIIETERPNIDPSTDTVINKDTIGQYQFNAVPVGNYVVRALYGNNKLDLPDTYGITGDPVAVNKDGKIYSNNENILTANYDNDNEGYTPAVYNGHDYKTTLYQVGVGADVDARYYDLNNDSLLNTRVNDFKDNEVQRLLTTAKSATMTNYNASVLNTANDKGAGHNKLYDNYNMFADSAIISISKDMPDSVKVSTNNNGISSYLVKQIDIGLIERPENNLVLDKQISSIKLITNDNRLILDAEYDVNYEIVNKSEAANNTVIARISDNKYLVAKVTLNVERSVSTDVIQAINKNENKLSDELISGTQNLRYINVDDEILQGCTIVIDYLMTALNVGEEDYVSEKLGNVISNTTLDDVDMAKAILNLAEELSASNRVVKNTKPSGTYVGRYYYTGDASKDKLVTTRVRQVVDYVDNDAVFIQDNNNKPNSSWRTTTEITLAGNGVEENRLVDQAVIPEFKLLDDKDRLYTSDTNRNIILSVDNMAEDVDTLTNATFEKMLTPYSVNSDEYKSEIRLTTSRTVASSDLTNEDALYDFENLAEVVKYQNTFGRRDQITTPGNANPRLGTFVVLSDNFERDSSATEVVTFTPPTGIEMTSQMTMQILLVVAAALGIVVVGIVIIKKKILK